MPLGGYVSYGVGNRKRLFPAGQEDRQHNEEERRTTGGYLLGAAFVRLADHGQECIGQWGGDERGIDDVQDTSELRNG